MDGDCPHLSERNVQYQVSVVRELGKLPKETESNK